MQPGSRPPAITTGSAFQSLARAGAGPIAVGRCSHWMRCATVPMPVRFACLPAYLVRCWIPPPSFPVRYSLGRMACKSIQCEAPPAAAGAWPHSFSGPPSCCHTSCMPGSAANPYPYPCLHTRSALDPSLGLPTPYIPAGGPPTTGPCKEGGGGGPESAQGRGPPTTGPCKEGESWARNPAQIQDQKTAPRLVTPTVGVISRGAVFWS